MKTTKKNYHPRQPYKPSKVVRPRKSVHNSRLPIWIARMPLVKKFSRMTKKRKILLAAWMSLSVLVVIGGFTTIYFANTLGSKESIMNRNKTGLTLTDQNGQVFYEFFNARSETYVPLDQISNPVKQALVSSEDKNFYKHHGFSPLGILNAVWQNIRPGGLDNGGSTLTQQLVASSLLTKDRSYLRKYQELVLSIEIERRYSKDQILEMYLNSVYFGEGAFGIEDASRIYFGKSAKDLNIAEASTLIGLLPAPSAYSPITGDPNKTEKRQDYVLRRMVEDGAIDAATSKLADDQPLTYSDVTTKKQFSAPQFALMAKAELEAKYGEEKVARSGYRVTTTLNLDLQNKAESAVADQINKLSRSSVSNGAAVAIDPKNGEIRALVGSHDWNDPINGKINMATTTRQPGSSFKPIMYASGIENKVFSAATIWQDKPTDFGGGYSPKNYDLRYHGNVTTRQALANSYNIPAVAALQKNGIENTLQTAKSLGISTLGEANEYGLSLALGTGQAKLTEMTNAFATFANSGLYNKYTTISKITDKNHNDIYKNKPKNKKAISSQTAYIMSSMMSDKAARASTFGSSLNLNGQRIAAVKTGTTEDYKDAWTIGYTPSLAVGVWIGNNDNTPMSKIAGSSGAAPVWRSIMNEAHIGKVNEEFTRPADITIRSICRNNGALAVNAGNNTITEYFRPGTLPTEKCNVSIQKQPEPEITNNDADNDQKPVIQQESNPDQTNNESKPQTENIKPQDLKPKQKLNSP